MTPSETPEECSGKLPCLVNGHKGCCIGCSFMLHREKDLEGYACGPDTCVECGAVLNSKGVWRLLPRRAHGTLLQCQR